MNRRAAEKRLRPEGVATPDITSATRCATLPKMGTRDASRAGQRRCPRFAPRHEVGGGYIHDQEARTATTALLGENGGDAVRARRDASLLVIVVLLLLLLFPRPLFIFFLFALSWKSPRSTSPNLDINAGHCRSPVAVICSSSTASLVKLIVYLAIRYREGSFG